MRRLRWRTLRQCSLLTGCAQMQPTPDKSVYFIEPKDGATVTSPFKVVFGVNGMAVEPAGDIKADSGHHHLLINLDAIKAGDGNSGRRHASAFRQGADGNARCTLPPGNYTLTMQFANGAHVSYGPPMAATIRVTVK